MVEGIVVTMLSCLVIVWIGFSMAGRDEARVSASTDLNRWYQTKQLATIIDIQEMELNRDYLSLFGRGVQEQSGYRLTLEYKDKSGKLARTKHYFYDESEQDEKFLSKYIQNNKIYIWLADNEKVYVPGEIIENKEVQTIYGAEKVLVYTLSASIVMGVVTSFFLIFLSPLWILIHLPIVLLSSLVPQAYMYIQEMSSEVQKKSYHSVSALNQFGIYIDEKEEGIRQFKLVEQTLPMVLLEEGVGYLGYTPDKVSVLVDYDGNIPVHIASEYHIPDIVTSIIQRLRN